MEAKLERKTIGYRVRVEAISLELSEKNEWAVISEKDGEKKFGYTPKQEYVKETNIEIYDQAVTKLNMPELVSVVNNIKGGE